MGSTRKISEKPSVPNTLDSIETLRTYFHSVHHSQRSEVIELLGSMSDPDAARELIQLYYDSQWRSTKLQITRILSKNPTQRSLEFLFRLALNINDLPIAETAVWSLGQSHHHLAALFLVNYYETCNEFIKPSVVGAIGQIPDRTLANEFLSLLTKILEDEQTVLAKNLILTLGELKVQNALSLLMKIASKNSHPLALSALVAIGKISRDPKATESLESCFRDDLFEYQLFNSVKTQVQFRSQWKLEDYLIKIFESKTFHPTLPFELNHFSPNDVREGLKLFSDPEHFERLCLALSKIDFPDISEWYAELIDIKNLHPEQTKTLLTSIGAHRSSKLNSLLMKLKEKALGFPTLWVETLSLCLPNAEVEFKNFFESPVYRGLDEDARISCINHLFNFGLTVQPNASQLHSIGKLFEFLLETETSLPVQARTVRALGFLGITSKKAFKFCKETLIAIGCENSAHSNLASSCLKFLELCPERSSIQTLLLKLEKKDAGTRWTDQFKSAFLRTIAALPFIPENHEELDLFLKMSLKSESSAEIKMGALRVIQNHPRLGFVNDVLSCLKSEEKVQLAGIIALRSLKDESSAEHLAMFLDSEQPSLSGRALDTLTCLPGMRAKRIVIDYLKNHGDDSDVCEKIIRCLNPPETPTDYFTGVVDELMKRFPNHPHMDGLILLREKVSPRKSGSERGHSPVRPEQIEAVDNQLKTKITGYQDFDEAIKSALRSAELPYLYREMFDESVDKSTSIVEYCKAIDLLLERSLGKSLLFPRLENRLHEFQNVLHAVGLNDEYPRGDRVITLLGLDKHFTPQSLPLHKMTLVAQGIRSGKIVNEHFKTLDGLRAWAIMLLLFGRKIQNTKPLIPLHAESDDQIISLSKRLIALQEVRNPVAHRQTVVKFLGLEEVRSEACSLLTLIQKVI